MECPECKSTHINKNGHKKGKQNYLCVNCGRQFIDTYESYQGYDPAFKKDCLKMYVNGMGFRAIIFHRGFANERVSGVHNTTIMAWVKQVGEILPDDYNPEQIPKVGELADALRSGLPTMEAHQADELETFVGSKKIRSGSGR